MTATATGAGGHGPRLRRIRVLAFDVDGVLTDGRVWFAGGDVGWNRFFDTKDGYMMQEMRRRGYKVGIVSGGDSRSLRERFGDGERALKVDFAFTGDEDKTGAYEGIKALGFGDEDILYMGDEFFDVPLLRRCGFSATVPEASEEIRDLVHYVTRAPGGRGAAREVMDMVRRAGAAPGAPGL